MITVLRIIRLALGIASPSQFFIGGPRGDTWLDRWERRVNARVARGLPAFFAALASPRWVLQLVDPLTGAIVKERDVSAYSHRSRRMRLNRWRRMQSHAGMGARLIQVTP